VDTVVGPPQPPGELGVEVGDVGEGPPGQEARLVVVVVALHDALGLRIVRVEDHGSAAERADEAREL
jgi:hypothetical protein